MVNGYSLLTQFILLFVTNIDKGIRKNQINKESRKKNIHRQRVWLDDGINPIAN